MKKNDLFLISSVAVYSYLFYQQAAGINYLLFAILQVVFFYLSHKENTKSLQWKIAAFAVIVSGVSTLWYGSGLAVTSSVISFCVLAFISVSPGTSIIMGLFHSVYSIGGSIIFMILDYLNKSEEENRENKNSKRFKNFAIFLSALLVMFLFFGLYRASNELFKNFTDQIDLSFISAEWIGFTLFGLFLLYGFYRYRGIKELENFDLNSPDNLTDFSSKSFFDEILSIQSEKKAGIVLFVMLNVLLLSVNIIDIVYLYGGAELPLGTSHSSMVHQGVNALITSIIMAVSIILFFFRGRLNFIRENKILRVLTYAWIAQNVFVIISTAFRNHLYIQEYFLTYKRVGVYIYLGLCIIGLVYTFIKIHKTKTNWFIVRYVGWSFYVLLFTFSTIDWDGIIINYNFSHGKENVNNLDIPYLINLPPRNIKKVYHHIELMNPSLLEIYSVDIENAIGKLLAGKENEDWRSYTVEGNKTRRWLNETFTHEQLSLIKEEHTYRDSYYSNSDYYAEY